MNTQREIDEALELIDNIESIKAEFTNNASRSTYKYNSLFLETLGSVLDDLKDIMKGYINDKINYESSKTTENK